MTEAAKVAAPIPNATILEEDDRAASAQLYWMMLMICKGAALNIVFLAGDSEGLEAWRQLTEKYEPKMRTRFAGELMSILSFSLQRDTTERIRAWEREIATCERDSGNVLDDEIKIGTFLLGLPASQPKTHLLMRVNTLKKWTHLRGEVVAISRAISTAQTQPTPSKRRRQTRQSSTTSKSKMLKFGSHFSEVPSLRHGVPKVRKSRSPGGVLRTGTCLPSVPRRRSVRWMM